MFPPTQRPGFHRFGRYLNVRQTLVPGKVFRVKMQGMSASGEPVEESDITNPAKLLHPYDVLKLGRRGYRALHNQSNPPPYLVRSLVSIVIDLEVETYRLQDGFPIRLGAWMNALNRVLKVRGEQKVFRMDQLQSDLQNGNRHVVRWQPPNLRFSGDSIEVKSTLANLTLKTVSLHEISRRLSLPRNSLPADLLMVDSDSVSDSIRIGRKPLRFDLRVELAPVSNRFIFDVRNLSLQQTAHQILAACHPLAGKPFPLQLIAQS